MIKPGEALAVPSLKIEMDPIWADIIAAGLAGWALAQRQRELEAEAEAALVPVPIPIPIEEEG
jgi:hypothetical protein